MRSRKVITFLGTSCCIIVILYHIIFEEKPIPVVVHPRRHRFSFDEKPLFNETISPTDSLAQAEDIVYSYAEYIDISCSDWTRAGKVDDGGWNVCTQRPFKPRYPCLVYSVGINYEWSFDDGIVFKFKCRVKSLDPSMEVGNYSRTPNIDFYQLGMFGENTITEEKKWKMLTFGTILNLLGDTDKTIDFLKFDIDNSEWSTLQTMFKEKSLRNVKQVAMEVHFFMVNSNKHLKTWIMYYDTLHTLQEQGFRKWSVNYNQYTKYISPHTGKHRTYCLELVYINTKYMKSPRGI